MSGDGFLSRWSRRKRASAAGEPPEAPPAAPPSPTTSAAATPAAAPVQPAPPQPLPPVESLSIDSDFTPFMAKEVDPTIQRAALRKLFEDERFNVMDGLDVYIDDYTKPAPIPAEWYERMAQMAHLGDAAPKPPPEPPVAGAPEEASSQAAAPPGGADATDISQNDVSPGEAPSPTPRDGASG